MSSNGGNGMAKAEMQFPNGPPFPHGNHAIFDISRLCTQSWDPMRLKHMPKSRAPLHHRNIRFRLHL